MFCTPQVVGSHPQVLDRGLIWLALLVVSVRNTEVLPSKSRNYKGGCPNFHIESHSDSQSVSPGLNCANFCTDNCRKVGKSDGFWVCFSKSAANFCRNLGSLRPREGRQIEANFWMKTLGYFGKTQPMSRTKRNT